MIIEELQRLVEKHNEEYNEDSKKKPKVFQQITMPEGFKFDTVNSVSKLANLGGATLFHGMDLDIGVNSNVRGSMLESKVVAAEQSRAARVAYLLSLSSRTNIADDFDYDDYFNADENLNQSLNMCSKCIQNVGKFQEACELILPMDSMLKQPIEPNPDYGSIEIGLNSKVKSPSIVNIVNKEGVTKQEKKTIKDQRSPKEKSSDKRLSSNKNLQPKKSSWHLDRKDSGSTGSNSGGSSSGSIKHKKVKQPSKWFNNLL